MGHPVTQAEIAIDGLISVTCNRIRARRLQLNDIPFIAAGPYFTCTAAGIGHDFGSDRILIAAGAGA
jgi:hypothetical protein